MGDCLDSIVGRDFAEAWYGCTDCEGWIWTEHAAARDVVTVAGGSLQSIELEAVCAGSKDWSLRIQIHRTPTQMAVGASVPPSTAHAVRAFDRKFLLLEQVDGYHNSPIPPLVDQVLVTG